MSYYNRLSLLDHTLKTINQSQHKNYEVIIVDDFSSESENPEQLKTKYPCMNLRVIQMKYMCASKTYINPCIPYNIGFGESRGDKIIIQNPECCHVGDVISYTENNLTNNVYLSFHCYACTENYLTKVHKGEAIPFVNNSRVTDGGCWYNHKVYRPASFHFTTAITRTRLRELNGFDERFAAGAGVDDNEFVSRVKKILPIKFIQQPYTIHQFHPKLGFNTKEAFGANKYLLRDILEKEPTNIRAYNDDKQIIT